METDDPDKPLSLLGSTVDVCYYDDDVALTEYVWKHYRHLLTPLEYRVGCFTGPITSNCDLKKVRYIYEHLEATLGHVSDADVLAAWPFGGAAPRFGHDPKAGQRIVPGRSRGPYTAGLRVAARFFLSGFWIMAAASPSLSGIKPFDRH